jgi:hypothetical protein
MRVCEGPFQHSLSSAAASTDAPAHLTAGQLQQGAKCGLLQAGAFRLVSSCPSLTSCCCCSVSCPVQAHDAGGGGSIFLAVQQLSVPSCRCCCCSCVIWEP